MLRRPLLALAATLFAAAAAAQPSLAPYKATFAVSYGGMSVGESQLELRREGSRWVLESRSNARGFARLVAPGELVQTSWFTLAGGQVVPARYRFDDGSDGDRNVALDFDWGAGRVTGTAEGRAVDVAVVPNLQDALSLQVAAATALAAGQPLEALAMIEKDKVKQYRYVFERREQLVTPAGTFDTLVYRSERAGSDRYSRLWFAPALHHLNVKAEQFRGTKRLFSLTLKTYQPR